MNTKLISGILAGLAYGAALGAVMVSSPVQAGFQWTAPANMPTAASSANTGTALPHVQAAPVAPVITEGLATQGPAAIPTTPDGPASAAPVYGAGMTDDPISWNTPYNARNAAVQAPRAPQSVLPAETQPLYNAPTPAPVMATPIMAAPVTATPAMITSTSTVTSAPLAPSPVGYGAYEVAEGFGSDLPLVMAIRQIVPPSYGFVFDDGINLSTNVSWQGGRPWNVVLQDVLTPLGLRAAINGTVVAIVPAGQPALMQQISVTGPAVTTDVVNAYAAGTAMAPVMTAPALPTPIMASPAIIEGPAFQATPVATRNSGGIDLGATTTWTAPRNSTLRGILEDWSERVNVELYWASEYDYPIQSGVSITGSFEEAVQTLLKGLNESKPRPLGRLHPNLPNGPAVLVIETRQNSM